MPEELRIAIADLTAAFAFRDKCRGDHQTAIYSGAYLDADNWIEKAALKVVEVADLK